MASGSGTNLQAILDSVHGDGEIEVVGVVSDKPNAFALERAHTRGIETAVFPIGSYPDRDARDAAVADWITERRTDLVVLAGYMALVTPSFLERFSNRVINVHPSLLPAFPGLRAVDQALARGVRVFGVTVHFVDEGVDTGPIILQRSIELPYANDADEVLAQLHPIEHRLLPEAIRLIARGRVRIDPENSRRIRLEED